MGKLRHGNLPTSDACSCGGHASHVPDVSRTCSARSVTECSSPLIRNHTHRSTVPNLAKQPCKGRQRLTVLTDAPTTVHGPQLPNCDCPIDKKWRLHLPHNGAACALVICIQRTAIESRMLLLAHSASAAACCCVLPIERAPHVRCEAVERHTSASTWRRRSGRGCATRSGGRQPRLGLGQWRRRVVGSRACTQSHLMR